MVQDAHKPGVQGAVEKEVKGELVRQDLNNKGKFGRKQSSDKGKVMAPEANKQRGKKDKKKELVQQNSVKTEQQLLDLNFSPEHSVQASSLPTDMEDILLPLKKAGEEGGEPSPNAVDPPVPKPRTKSLSRSPGHAPGRVDTDSSESGGHAAEGMGVSRFSVAKLSELFDKGLSPQQPIWSPGGVGRTGDWSTAINTPSPERAAGPALSPAPSARKAPSVDMNLEEVTKQATPSDSVNKGVGVEPLPTDSAYPDDVSSLPSQANTSYDHTHPISCCQVLYNYQGKDNTEVSIVEGDIVTVLPREDASPGWVMVRLADGSEGWVPQSYLEQHADSAVAGDSDVGREVPCEEEGRGGGGQEDASGSVQPDSSSSSCE